MISILPAGLVPNVVSEIRKLVTMPHVVLVASVLLTGALLASITSATFAGPVDPAGQPVTGTATLGLYVGLALLMLAAAAVGAKGGGGEFEYHTMQVSTLLSVDRDRLAAAKFFVTGCCALASAVAVEIVALVGLFGAGRGKISVTLELVAVLGGGALATVCWALIGLSTGVLLRSSSRAVALLLGWIVLAEPILWLLASGIDLPGVAAVLPLSATVATVAVGSFSDTDILAPPAAAAVVLVLWTAGLSVATWRRLRTEEL
ncbi:ABC transporter permease [Nocardia sp. CNY236]|uniref:ABC transporter permease n=1 Tax=Nocardia sp. CNY236 TaxID=1169152 RepID=UPI00041727FA|nr:ABC transporter permease [Nocardia sp. CNY236]